MKPNRFLLILAGLLLAIGIAAAATLTYSPAAPQTGDSALVISNKAAVAATTTATQTTAAASALAVQNAGSSFANVTTATTTAVKASAGVLERIIVNTAGAGSTLTIYNNTAGSGAKVGTMTTAAQGCFEFNVNCTTGITVVSASGTPADITVVYR
jgi:4-hydroxyphenylpyruvate dioxygenase-like putative hemolysin